MSEKDDGRPWGISAAGMHRDDWKAKAKALQREFSKDNREQSTGAEHGSRGSEKPAASHDLEPSILDKKEGAERDRMGAAKDEARAAQKARFRSREHDLDHSL
jgi:hypothetical protein